MFQGQKEGAGIITRIATGQNLTGTVTTIAAGGIKKKTPAAGISQAEVKTKRMTEAAAEGTGMVRTGITEAGISFVEPVLEAQELMNLSSQLYLLTSAPVL